MSKLLIFHHQSVILFFMIFLLTSVHTLKYNDAYLTKEISAVCV